MDSIVYSTVVVPDSVVVYFTVVVSSRFAEIVKVEVGSTKTADEVVLGSLNFRTHQSTAGVGFSKSPSMSANALFEYLSRLTSDSMLPLP